MTASQLCAYVCRLHLHRLQQSLWKQLLFFTDSKEDKKNPGQEDGIWGQFLGASTVTYSKLMLEDNSIYLRNVCSAKINSGVFLWQQTAPNPTPNTQNS